jgi:hypothetical protein
MIRVTEKYFYRNVNTNRFRFERQRVSRKTTWLLWVIPIYSRDEVLSATEHWKNP